MTMFLMKTLLQSYLIAPGKALQHAPHVYDGQIQTPQGFQRPLETCIFDYQFLKEILPFKLQGGADWLLLQRAFNMQSVYEAQDVILYKAKHGRNM
jgi:hypothetical protein